VVNLIITGMDAIGSKMECHLLINHRGIIQNLKKVLAPQLVLLHNLLLVLTAHLHMKTHLWII
jgi:hypothetical protein